MFRFGEYQFACATSGCQLVAFSFSLQEAKCNDIFRNRCLVNLRESDCLTQIHIDSFKHFSVKFICVNLKSLVDSTVEDIESEGSSCPALHCMNHILISAVVSPLMFAGCILYIRFQVKKRSIDPPASANESPFTPASVVAAPLAMDNMPYGMINDPYSEEERRFSLARGRGRFYMRGRASGGGMRGVPSGPANWTQ